jgi:Fe-S-cluster containining protein
LCQKYLRQVGLRHSILEQPQTKDCIFLRKQNGRKKCIIYSVRPNQCRTWPFWPANLRTPDDWQRTAKKCPGVNTGKFYSLQEIENIKNAR